MSDASALTSEYWGKNRKQARPVSWLEHKVILDFVHRRVTGDPNVNTYEWFRRRYFSAPLELSLSLGCGLGAFERSALELDFSKNFHAVDISAGAIVRARRAAAQAGLAERIDYKVVDLDQVVIPMDTYNAIFALSAVHHISNLENLFEQCRGGLKRGGLMFLDEYIGPSRFQTAPNVTELINKLLAILPPRHRRSLFANDGTTIDHYVPSPIDHFLKTDPSEAIRSADILAVLKRSFDIIEFRPYGGAILHMLLSGIAGNFDENDESDVTLLAMLATFEELLENCGVIASDFAAIVARPKA